MRLALCVPAALLANLLRIGTIAAYRGAFHPHWESIELHYLIGFVWLAPFIVLLAKGAAREARTPWMAVAYLVSVLSLLARVNSAPTGGGAAPRAAKRRR